MNKIFNDFKSDLEIQLLLTKSKNNVFALKFNRTNNTFILIFDDIDIAMIFYNYFTKLPHFKIYESNIVQSGTVNIEYTFRLPIKFSELEESCRTVRQYYSYSSGANSDIHSETHLFNLNSHTLDYIFEMIKQMFDESNKVLNIEKLCNNEI